MTYFSDMAWIFIGLFFLLMTCGLSIVRVSLFTTLVVGKTLPNIARVSNSHLSSPFVDGSGISTFHQVSALAFYASLAISAAVTTYGFLHWWHPFFAVLISVFGITTIVGLFSMTLGEMLGRSKSAFILSFSQPLLIVLSFLFYPLLQIERYIFRQMSEKWPPFYSLPVEQLGIVSETVLSSMEGLSSLAQMAVDDVMIPRAKIEAIDFEQSIEALIGQLVTSHHPFIPLYREEISNVMGVLDLSKTLWALRDQTLTHESLERLLTKPHFVPSQTSALAYLYESRQAHQAISFVVDEYGDILGLVSQDDLMGELLGDRFFTDSADFLKWDREGTCTIEGTAIIRDINYQLGIGLPVEGPKTINGLLLDVLEEIPDDEVSLIVENHVIDILQIQDKAITRVRVYQLPFSEWR